MTSPKPRIAVLISGSGSNLQALLDAAAQGALAGEISAVISNRNDAYGLQRAAAAGLEQHVVDHRNYPDRESFDAALVAKLKELDTDIVVLAGFMRILTPTFIEPFWGRLLNIHPSLLPAFRGLHTHQRALEEQVSEHGCTVHFVTPELDAGPSIIQGVIRVTEQDTEQTLQRRTQRMEHLIYPRAVDWLSSGRLELDGNLPRLDGEQLRSPVRLHEEETENAQHASTD
ncbi:phosphoribosylglycinamide formyltransferase [Halorhodospira halochloris]|uniref:Phosphoribosylglycinamide formyltransferase n=1 Tax=Halorhodospira halochloris TaxID=1052 RepID=A0A0X8X7V6_HALHR|nr:phosphoribosylglycinamide formyltransferase [Halorhodospira halochloris]MBK1651577.1 phosphoribosylglycinamide formyltransferase [Halorhodospira halochloris]BAU57155.1 phosphoribosylglycinamide formyltransferase [Halorhodospira halochloris]